MTLEQLGFIKRRIYDRVYYRREKMFGSYREYIEFDLSFKEVETTNIDTMDMMLLEAIYLKAKELFNR